MGCCSGCVGLQLMGSAPGARLQLGQLGQGAGPWLALFGGPAVVLAVVLASSWTPAVPELLEWLGFGWLKEAK